LLPNPAKKYPKSIIYSEFGPMLKAIAIVPRVAMIQAIEWANILPLLSEIIGKMENPRKDPRYEILEITISIVSFSQ
jgi:hypothetical protein